MHFSNIVVLSLAGFLGLVAAQSTTTPVTGLQGNATVIENNPPGVVYTATLPTSVFFQPQLSHGNIVGSVAAVAKPNGIGVEFQVNFSNLPATGGPFLYHIHAFPVPADGNCNGTLGHLDPFIRGEKPACDPNLPQTCQVGDLSGKYGKITSDPFLATYTDEFATTVEGLGAFFGNRSITLHFANATRLTCANFTLSSTSGTSGTNGTGTGSASSTLSGPSATSSTPVTQTSTTPPIFSGMAVTGSAPVSFALLSAMGVAFLL